VHEHVQLQAAARELDAALNHTLHQQLRQHLHGGRVAVALVGREGEGGRHGRENVFGVGLQPDETDIVNGRPLAELVPGTMSLEFTIP
jgi:hypothetical protein